MSTKSLNITSELHQYMFDKGVQENSVLRQLREFTQTMPGGRMQISPVQGQFMRFLVSLIQPKRVLEIGTFTGYSALCMALNLPSDGKIITCDIDAKTTAVAQTHWQQAGVDSKIELHLGPALETLESLPETVFDLIFIDADKRNYLSYYEACLDRLSANGVMLIDNVLWGGAVTDNTDESKQTMAIRELNDRVQADARVIVSMIPIGDGLTLIKKV